MPLVKVPPEIAEQHARMAELAMLAGERDRALAAINRAFETAKEVSGEFLTETSPLAGMLSVRIVTILDGNGIRTVGDLIKYSPEELARVQQIRWKSVAIIQRQLEKHGFALARESRA